MIRSAKRGWVSNRRCTLVTQRTGVNQVMVDGDVLASQDHHAWYIGARGVVRYDGSRPVRLAAVVAGGLCIHRDGDRTNCQRSNLLRATFSQVLQGRRKRKNTRSAYKGVTPYGRGRWQVRVADRHVAYCATEIEAARMYDQVARETFGPYARTNFPVDRTPQPAD